MSEIELINDPALPMNTFVVKLPDEDEPTYVVEHGSSPDGSQGCSVSDMEADHEDSRVTQLEYGFKHVGAGMAHQVTVLHRHAPDGSPVGGDGECEQAPPEQEPVPDIVVDIVAEAFDVPVIAPDGEP